MIWIMVLVTVLKTGEVYTELRWPKTAEMNNQQECERQANLATNEEQMKLGLNNGVVVFNCQSIPYEDVKGSVKTSGQGI